MNSNNIFKSKESSVRSYCRSFPAVFEKAKQSFLWDENGDRYIDFFAGAGALNYGHNPDAITHHLVEYLASSSICHSLDFHTKAKQDFLTKFNDVILKPRNLSHRVMFPGPTGTNAVEAAMKVARLSTNRTKIASFTNGFHGMTMGALAATGNSFNRSGAGASLTDIDRYPYDQYFGPNIDTVDLIEQLLADPSSGYEAPAAFLLETVQAEGGINVASSEWLIKLSKLAKKVGSLLIVDDIQVGCGRTGSFFSFEDAGIVPDLICLSKSISGYGFPMSLVLVSPEHDVFQPGQHNGTFRGNNLAFVAATQTLSFWQDEQAMISRTLDRSRMIRQELDFIPAEVGPGYSVRGRGLIIGLECPSGDIASLIANSCFDNGLIIETCGAGGEVIKFLPAINIPVQVLEDGLSIFNESVFAHAGQLQKVAVKI